MLPSSALRETLSKPIKLQVEMNGTQQQKLSQLSIFKSDLSSITLYSDDENVCTTTEVLYHGSSLENCELKIIV